MIQFSTMKQLTTTLSSWNILIRNNVNKNSFTEAFRAFLTMRAQGIRPDNFTYPFLFKACSARTALKQGKQIHADVIKHGLDHDVYINNTMIHFYGSCKKIMHACRVFEDMHVKDVVSWNSVISACVENSKFGDSVRLFCTMREKGFVPNETSMVGLLSACAEMGNLVLGKWMHSQVTVSNLLINCELGTSLVNMYTKCGDLYSAHRIFEKMEVKNVWTWSAMILGFAQHGFALEALKSFNEMKLCGLKPNHVTFLGILCACSHAQLVEDGIRFFHDMQHEYNIRPSIAHYGAMVDCFSRSGRIREGYDFAINMPMKPDGVLWRTLLSASHIHDVNDYTGVAEEVKEKLLELEPNRIGNYVMLANNYAEVGMWGKAEHLRDSMRDKGNRKGAGESCVQIGSFMCRFVSGKKYPGLFEGVYPLLDVLNLHMK